MKLREVFWVLLISMVPLIELRGAIPVGTALGLPFYLNYLMAVLGNLLPVPFILLFIPVVLDFMARFKIFRPIVDWLRKKAYKNSSKIAKGSDSEQSSSEKSRDTKADAEYSTCQAEKSSATTHTEVQGKVLMPKGAFLGLALFVLLPIPGTGAWTGALVAALFNFPKMKSLLAIALGVLGCGVIMCLASYGVLGFLSFLL